MDVDKVAFTGSTEVGHLIMEAAAKTNLKRVTLELGGKSPNIVFADADMDAAIEGAHFALFFNQGQCCCAGSRLFVEEKAYDEFVERSAARAKTARWAIPSIPKTRTGSAGGRCPVRQSDGLHRIGKEGRREAGGRRQSRGRSRLTSSSPPSSADVKDNMKIAEEEIFGPVHEHHEIQGHRRGGGAREPD